MPPKLDSFRGGLLSVLDSSSACVSPSLSAVSSRSSLQAFLRALARFWLKQPLAFEVSNVAFAIVWLSSAGPARSVFTSWLWLLLASLWSLFCSFWWLKPPVASAISDGAFAFCWLSSPVFFAGLRLLLASSWAQSFWRLYLFLNTISELPNVSVQEAQVIWLFCCPLDRDLPPWTLTIG
jgi:hypothetical protein